MSGEGLLSNAGIGRVPARAATLDRTAEVERADTLAYFQRKIANAELMIARSPEHADAAMAARRAWEIARDDIRGGLHLGEADLNSRPGEG